MTLGTGELEWRKRTRVSSARFCVSENRSPAQSRSWPCRVLSRVKNTCAEPLAQGPGCGVRPPTGGQPRCPRVCAACRSPGSAPRGRCFGHAGAHDLPGRAPPRLSRSRRLACRRPWLPGLPCRIPRCPARVSGRKLHACICLQLSPCTCLVGNEVSTCVLSQ